MALHHLEAGEVARLSPLGAELRSTRTHALVKTERFEALRLVVPAGSVIPEHSVEGPVTVHCLEGHCTFTRKGERLDLRAGDWLHLEPGEPHALKGVEDASLLVTIIFP